MPIKIYNNEDICDELHELNELEIPAKRQKIDTTELFCKL